MRRALNKLNAARSVREMLSTEASTSAAADLPTAEEEIALEEEVAVEEDGPTLVGTGQESRFYTCHVCGDNWLSVKEVGTEGSCKITFVHQMGMAPVLKRVAHMQANVLLSESAVGLWEYYVDDVEIEETTWHAKLSSRRRVLKSICSNWSFADADW